MLHTPRKRCNERNIIMTGGIICAVGLIGIFASTSMRSSETCDGIDPTKPCQTVMGGPMFEAWTYWTEDNQVFQSYTWDFTAEVEHMQSIMNLKPGMTYCEMGAANGLFFAQMAKKVMPGGKVYGTAPSELEVARFQQTAKDVGIPESAITGTLATNEPAYLGLPPDTCDVIYSRMVYHMIPEATAKAYLTQLAKALKKDGMLFFTDHDPDNDKWVRGEATVLPFKMKVVPMAVEIEEFKEAGFTLQRVIRNWPYFGDSAKYGDTSPDEYGYGLVWSHEK